MEFFGPPPPEKNPYGGGGGGEGEGVPGEELAFSWGNKLWSIRRFKPGGGGTRLISIRGCAAQMGDFFAKKNPKHFVAKVHNNIIFLNKNS